MLTCHVRYVINPVKLAEFEHYAKLWIPLVEELGGQHHGYFLPTPEVQEGNEAAGNTALCLFSFPSLDAFKAYRETTRTHAGCQAAYAYAERTGCLVSYEWSFYRPVLAQAAA